MSMRNTANLARGCRACVASLAGFALVILSASFAAALYGPRTTIGTNYQQWSNTTSKNGVDQGFCGSTQVCLVLFQRAPQQKALIIEHVSCLVHVNSGELLEANIETRKGQTIVPTDSPRACPDERRLAGDQPPGQASGRVRRTRSRILI
jgi:hypothetical protein